MGKTKSGKKVVIQLCLDQIEDATTGRPIFVAVLHDITELRQAMQMKEAILQSARSPMVVSTKDGTILQVNHAVTTEVFGYTQVRVRPRLRVNP